MCFVCFMLISVNKTISKAESITTFKALKIQKNKYCAKSYFGNICLWIKKTFFFDLILSFKWTNVLNRTVSIIFNVSIRATTTLASKSVNYWYVSILENEMFSCYSIIKDCNVILAILMLTFTKIFSLNIKEKFSMWFQVLKYTFTLHEPNTFFRERNYLEIKAISSSVYMYRNQSIFMVHVCKNK